MVLLASTPALAQDQAEQTSVWSVLVKDAAGAVIPGATVDFKSPQIVLLHAVSDRNGIAALTHGAEAAGQLTVTARGFRAASIPIQSETPAGVTVKLQIDDSDNAYSGPCCFDSIALETAPVQDVVQLEAVHGTVPDEGSDEAAVRSVIETEIQGWQMYDPKQVADLYTDDAIWQNPFGVRLHGRAALLAFLTDLMNRPGFRAGKSTTPWKILDVRMLSPTTATVWSDERIEGVVPGNNAIAIPLRHSYYLEALTKRDGTWKITDFMVMDIVHPK